ncbi:MAG: Zn-dependent hydrolase [Acetobacteraceae bacterium]|nr:Zn-dependent hydrolase [Acetobacteraceae bacterium]
MRNVPLSGARLWADLMAVAKIGGTAKGGCNRQTLTDEDGRVRHWLADQARALGCTVTVDRLGNMAIRREGRDAARKPVAFGSHLDTQPTGGKFDGILGVLAGLELLRALHEAGAETEAPLLLVNWTNEEGARFSPPMMGSGGAMGLFAEAEILAKQDSAGAVFGAELARIGWQGEGDPRGLQDIAAYLELHIEQGPLLEREGASIGVVTHALAQRWYDVTVTGEEAHGGSLMAGRRDALVAASLLIAEIERVALASGGNGRATVGRLTVAPDSRNIVPARVWFSVDTRHDDAAGIATIETGLRAAAASLAAARGIAIEVTEFWDSPLTPFDAALVRHVEDAAKARGLAYRRMPTGIGHDAVYVARKAPAAMIFVPCHGGVSHNEAESITPEWAEAGLLVLADAVLAAANA